MKTKRIWKKFVSYVLATVMLVSIFTFVDMGWNVMEVQAATTLTITNLKVDDIIHNGDTIQRTNTNKDSGFFTYESGDGTRDSFMGTTTDSSKTIIWTKTGFSKFTCHGIVTEIGVTNSNGYSKGVRIKKYHIYDTLATCTTPAKCMCGATSGSALGHDWSNNDGICARDTLHRCEHPGQTGKATCEICGKPLHTHGNFEYTATGYQLTATCKNTGCTDPAESKTITINQAGGTYTGLAFTATLEGTDDFNSLTGKSVSVADIKYYKGDDKLTEAPKNAGTYKAKITVEGSTATKEFSIMKINPVKEDFTYTTPTSLVYDGNGKTATVTAKDGKTNGTITVKYYAGDTVVASPTEAGTYKVKITVTEGDNYNVVTTPLEVGEFTIGKGDYTGTKTASGDLVAKTDKTVDITLPELPDGASYGTAVNSNTSFFTVGTVSDGKVTVTSKKNWDKDSESAAKTFTIPVTGATNYNNYDVTVTITPKFHTHNFSYTATDNKIEATCANTDNECDLTSNPVLVLSASDTIYEVSEGYEGASVDSSAWTESGLATVPAIVYKKVTTKGSTTGGVEASAINLKATAGYYYASITVDGKTAVKAFTVNKVEGPSAPTGLNPVSPQYIGGEDGKITGVDETMEYSTDGGETWKPVTGNEITGLKAGDVLVRVKETDTTKPGTPATVTILDSTEKNPAPSAPTDLTPVAPQKEGGEDGKITGVDETMEYSTDGGETWTPVTGNEITDLPAGPVKVRVKETDTTKPGTPVSITIPEGEKGSINDIVESVELSGTPEVGETLTVTVTLKDGKDGTIEYQWYRDSDEIEGATKNKYVLVEADKDKVVKVRVTVDGYDSYIDKSTSTSVHGRFIPHIENPAVPTEVSREDLKAAISKESLPEEAKQKLEAGKNIIVELVVKDNAHIEEASKEAITSALDKAKSDKEDVKVEKYLDISLFWYFEEESDEKNKIETAEQDITIALKVPNADPNKEYAVARNHKGKVSIIGDYDSDTETITIKSRDFSDYAICSWKADGKKEKKEKEEIYIDYDTFKSELPSHSVLAMNPADLSQVVDLKVHALNKTIADNQEFLANSFAKQLGKKAKIVVCYGVYTRNDIPTYEDGVKKVLVWNNLPLKTPGEIYAICYNQKDGAYYLTGTVNANGTAVFNNYLYRDATNITLFTLE